MDSINTVQYSTVEKRMINISITYDVTMCISY